MLSSLVRRGVCPNFVATRGVFSCPYEPPANYWGTAENKRPRGKSYVSPKQKRKPRTPADDKRGRYQYIRMELCDSGDAEEFLKTMEVEPDVISYNTHIHALAQHGGIPGYAKQANDVLDQMEDAYRSGKQVSVRPNLFSYNLVIDGWSRLEEPEAAWNAVRV